MKNIYKIISGAALIAALASCDLNTTPEFDDADAFVAFDVTAVSVNEDKGTLSIPVTVASVNPMNVTVSYVTEDGSAKAGENYSLVDESAVLVFDGTTRTQNIEIKITDIDNYTGNMTFNIRLVSAGSLKLGAESVCTVTIVDMDHPLASIVGDYTIVANDYFAGSTASWTMTFMTDPSDEYVIWIDGLCQGMSGYPDVDYRFFGNVTMAEDGQSVVSIALPCGQKAVSSVNGNDAVLWSFDGEGVNNTGNITMTQTEPGVFTIEEGYGIGYDAGDGSVSLFGLYLPGAVLTKN